MGKTRFDIAILLAVAGVLAVAVSCNAAPRERVVFCSINQAGHRLYKISNAVLTRAFNHLSIDFDLREMPPKRIAVELNKGFIDGDTHRIYDFNRNNAYANIVRVEEPIQVVPQSIFTKHDQIKVHGWHALRRYKVLYISGIKVIENALAQAGFPIENRLGVYDIDTAFKLLDSGRGDIVVVSPSTGNNAIKKLGLTGSNIKMLEPPLITIKLYPYMNKKHADLAQKLAVEIRSMKHSGEYDKIISSIVP